MNFSFLKNKVIFYLASRYITYAVQFVTTLIIAAGLGPYYMGIWGFILLMLNYFDKLNFGISYSFNILYVQHRDEKKECDNYIWNSMILVSYLATIIIFLYVVYLISGFDGFEKYHASRYMLWVSIIAILQYYSSLFINLFRVKNKLNHVSLCQSIIVLLSFFCVLIFRNEALIIALIASYAVGNFVSVVLAFTSGMVPNVRIVSISWQYQSVILKKGLHLFLYNSCFYFIIISIRTIISGYYEVEEFGKFTFSFSLAHAILLLLEALSFIIFPKILSKLSSPDETVVRNTIRYLRYVYITSAHFFIYLALPIFPLFLDFFPKYNGVTTALNLIALSILVNTNSTGYPDLLMAKNKEKVLMKLSFFALLINCTIALILVKLVRVDYSYVIMATLLTYFVYSFCVMASGEKLLERQGLLFIIKEYFPLRLAVPYLGALFISLLQKEGIFLIIPLAIFVVMNYKIIVYVKEIAIKLLFKPEMVNL